MAVDRRAYLFALAPVLVVVAVTPALALFVPSPIRVELGVWRLAGLPVVGAGLALAAWAVRTFARAGEAPSPAAEPERLVTGGPLAYTRNPIYLGTVCSALGVGVVAASVVVVLYAVALWAVYHAIAVYREEPELRAALGEDYDRYRDRVPRWL